MFVLFLHIPVHSRKGDLQAFIEPVLNKGIFNTFRKKGRIVEIKMLRYENRHLMKEELHGAVKIEPDSEAKRLIRCLNRKLFNGKHINVREYKRRLLGNDARRIWNYEIIPANIPNRRKTDRRRDFCVPVEKIYVSGEKVRRWEAGKGW